MLKPRKQIMSFLNGRRLVWSVSSTIAGLVLRLPFWETLVALEVAVDIRRKSGWGDGQWVGFV